MTLHMCLITFKHYAESVLVIFDITYQQKVFFVFILKLELAAEEKLSMRAT